MIRKPFQKIVRRKPGRRNNSKKHGIYAIEKAGRGSAVLENRSPEARIIRDLKRGIAQDLGFSAWGQMPRIKAILVERFCYKVLMLEMIEGMDPKKLTATLREDYFKFSSGLLRYAALIGVERLAKDVTPSLSQIRDAYTVEGEGEGE